jgi:hypothetical protein
MVQAWELMSVCSARPRLLQNLLADPAWSQYLAGAQGIDELIGPRARERLTAEVPAPLCTQVLSRCNLHYYTEGRFVSRRPPYRLDGQPQPPPLTAQQVYDRYGGSFLVEIHEHGRAAIPGQGGSWPQAVARCRTAILREFLKVFVVLPLAFLAVLVVAVLGAAGIYGRRGRRITRRLRGTARKIGAYEGHLLAAEAGWGVFGEGPYWRVITTLRQGSADDIGRAQLQRALDAGYQLADAQTSATGFRFPGTPSLPEFGLTVIAQRQLLCDDGSRWFAYPQRRLALRRRGASAGPVLAWGPTGGIAGPGTAVQWGDGKVRYSRLALPVVPAGATAIRIHLAEPARRRESTAPVSEG